MRSVYLFWGVAVVFISTFLFLVANEVDQRETLLGSIREDIRKTSQDIQVLRAEWSYLNEPARLDLLATEHLGLKPLRADQYISIDQLEFAPEPGEPQEIEHHLPADGAFPMARVET